MIQRIRPSVQPRPGSLRSLLQGQLGRVLRDVVMPETLISFNVVVIRRTDEDCSAPMRLRDRRTRLH